MKKNLTLAALVGMGILTFGQKSQQVFESVYPKIQQYQAGNGLIPVNGIKPTKSGWLPLIQRTPAASYLRVDKDALKLNIQLKKSTTADMIAGISDPNRESYDLKISKKGIDITAKDSIGVFYALQTLSQLIQGNQIPEGSVSDYPSVTYRGVVEGFYGTPWSTADRESQLKFYGEVKANTYIYGPKDDPYHRSPHWRDPYPTAEAQQIKHLVKIARANFVDFVWAIHPGGDIQWNDTDRDHVLRKFESMYDLGVRSFAVFFDDISGEGTKADKQAGLLNYITDHFIKVKKDVKPLILTPTEYNKGWANPGSEGYLSVLGRELDPSVQVMWTGDKVVDDITHGTLAWVKERIQRPALVWWNFPVSDYVKDHLLLGESYGLAEGVKATEMSGILSNPMEHAEASKPAIFGLADYAWNTTKYDPDRAFEQSLEVLFPKTHEVYRLFAVNNSDPGKNWHGYRRKESVEIAPALERIEKGVETGNFSMEDINQAEAHFSQIAVVDQSLREANEQPALLKEVTPWLHDFTYLGQRGVAQFENLKTSDQSAEVVWNGMLRRMLPAFTPIISMSLDSKIIPTTGTLVLRPFVDFLQNHNNQTILTKITGQTADSPQKAGLGTITTNIPNLKLAQLQAGADGSIEMRSALEVFKIQPNQSFTLALSRVLNQAEILSGFESDSTHWMTIEVSNDGKTWKAVNTNEDKKKIKAEVNAPFRFVRTTNQGDQEVALKLSYFRIKNTDASEETGALYATDGDVFTAFDLKSGHTFDVENFGTAASSVIVLTSGTTSDFNFEILNQNKWTAVQATGSNLLEIQLPKEVTKLRMTAQKDAPIYEVLWK